MDITLGHDEDLISFGYLALVFKVTVKLIGQLQAFLVVGGHLIVHVVCSWWCFIALFLFNLKLREQIRRG